MLKLYNTLKRKKEAFKPLKSGKVGMYACGPTVNGVPHLGHARNKVSFDVMRRYLRFLGYNVKFVSNITDIDDKIINAANKAGVGIDEFSKKNIKTHIKDYKILNVEKPDVEPKATEYVNEMVSLVKKLEEKGFTYLIEGYGIYYDISKFKGYGKLSQQKIEDLQGGKRIVVKEGKKNEGDFVLWKLAKPNEPSWNSPWGKGRPGWHIECSAMTKSILGVPFDIHAGGADLIFPHHEDEIAQSESAYGKKMANYWVHNGMVNVDGTKMGKSLGNFRTIQDLLKKYEPMVIRYFVISNQYRKPADFSDTALEDAGNSYSRLKSNIQLIKNDGNVNKGYVEKFRKEMDDDLNTPRALAVLWKLVKDKKAEGKLGALKKMDEVFGLDLLKKEKLNIPAGIKKLADKRQKAREDKDWSKADELRDDLKKKGWSSDDNQDGYVLSKI
jgi:cysteinyl-tRNA synthetase